MSTEERKGSILANVVEASACISTHPDDAASIGDATFKPYLTQRVSHPDVSTTA
jgi:hypothetical protein